MDNNRNMNYRKQIARGLILTVLFSVVVIISFHVREQRNSSSISSIEEEYRAVRVHFTDDASNNSLKNHNNNHGDNSIILKDRNNNNNDNDWQMVINKKRAERRRRISQYIKDNNHLIKTKVYSNGGIKIETTLPTKYSNPSIIKNSTTAEDYIQFCGREAQKASKLYPELYPSKLALNSNSTVFISNLLGPVGINLALKLKYECGVEVVTGSDPFLPHTVPNRLDAVTQRLNLLTRNFRNLRKKKSPIILSYLGLHAKSNSKTKNIKAATEYDIVKKVKPTHIVHLSNVNMNQVYNSTDVRGITSYGDYPPFHLLRQSTLGMEQILHSMRKSLVRSGKRSVPALVYLTSINQRAFGFSKKINSHQEYSSMVTEAIASTYLNRFGIHSTGLRMPSTVFGPWDYKNSTISKTLSCIIREISKGFSQAQVKDSCKDAEWYENHWNTIIHVDDVVDGIIAALQIRAPDSPVLDITPEMKNTSSLKSSLVDEALSLLKEKDLIDVNSSIASENPIHNKLLQWGLKFSLKHGILNTFAWQYDQIYPFGSPYENATSPYDGDSLSVIEKNGISKCSSTDEDCLRGRTVFPCASDCSKAETCTPSVYDPIITFSRNISYGCKLVMFTVDLNTTIEELPVETDDPGAEEVEVCKFAFVSDSSPMVQNFIKLQWNMTDDSISPASLDYALNNKGKEPEAVGSDATMQLMKDSFNRRRLTVKVNEGPVEASDPLLSKDTLTNHDQDDEDQTDNSGKSDDDSADGQVAFSDKAVQNVDDNIVDDEEIGSSEEELDESGPPDVASAKTEREDEEVVSDSSKLLAELNGRIVHRGWVLIWLPTELADNRQYSVADRLLPKLSPGKLFSHTVEYSMFVDSNSLSVPPLTDDLRFLASEMRRGILKERPKWRNKDGVKRRYVLPPDLERRAAVIASPMNLPTPTDQNGKLNLWEVVNKMKEEFGIALSEEESDHLTLQRDFYYKTTGYLNKPELRSIHEPLYYHEFKHWVKTRWVLFDMKLEESRLFRCEWYKEQLDWKNEIDPLGFAYIMAKNELQRKVGRQELDERSKPIYAINPETLQLIDYEDWFEVYNERRGWVSQRETEELKTKLDVYDDSPMFDKVRGGNASVYIRIISNRQLWKSRRMWNQRNAGRG